jgi:hypothetical protein
MHLALAILLGASLTTAVPLDPMRAPQWVELDLFHVSRTFPSFSGLLDDDVNPGIQLGYHRNVIGGGTFGGGFSFQAGYFSFDQLLFALSLGSGLEGTARTTWGLFAALGLRLDYARAFTGSNNFVHERGSYRQETDAGRGFLRISPVDLTLGYSPPALQRLGLVPALRFAWLVDAPLYESDDANSWSYTTFGLSVVWAWEGKP